MKSMVYWSDKQIIFCFLTVYFTVLISMILLFAVKVR